MAPVGRVDPAWISHARVSTGTPGRVRMNSPTPTSDATAHSSRPVVTSTTPDLDQRAHEECGDDAAGTGQGVPAGHRRGSVGERRLVAHDRADADVDRRPGDAAEDGRDEQDADVRGEGVADERQDAEDAADAHADEAAVAIGDRPPDREGDRRRQRIEDADDTDHPERQLEPVDVDQGEQRGGRDEAAAVEPLRHGQSAQDRALTQGMDGLAGAEHRRPTRRLGAEQGVPDSAADADDAGQRDDRRAAEPVGQDAAGQCRDRRGRRATHAAEAQDAAADAGRVHHAPQPKVEWPAERQAHPVHDRDADHHRRDRHEQDADEGDRAKAADRRSSCRGDRRRLLSEIVGGHTARGRLQLTKCRLHLLHAGLEGRRGRGLRGVQAGLDVGDRGGQRRDTVLRGLDLRERLERRLECLDVLTCRRRRVGRRGGGRRRWTGLARRGARATTRQNAEQGNGRSRSEGGSTGSVESHLVFSYQPTMGASSPWTFWRDDGRATRLIASGFICRRLPWEAAPASAVTPRFPQRGLRPRSRHRAHRRYCRLRTRLGLCRRSVQSP